MFRTMMMALTTALAIGASGSAAQATVLNFLGGSQPGAGDANCIENGIAGCYGDHASGSPDARGSTLLEGNGWTQHIGVAYSGSLRVWTNGFGADAYLGSGDNVNTGYFTLTADPGYQIRLNSITLDIDGGGGTVDLLSGGPGGTFLQSLAVSGHANPTLYTLDLLGTAFTVADASWNWGITQVNFDEVALASTPIPAALPLFGSALFGLGLFGWRRRRAA